MHVTVSYISELQTETSSCAESGKCDDNDEGKVSLFFWCLLFFTGDFDSSLFIFIFFFRISSVFYISPRTNSWWTSTPCAASANSQLKVLILSGLKKKLHQFLYSLNVTLYILLFTVTATVRWKHGWRRQQCQSKISYPHCPLHSYLPQWSLHAQKRKRKRRNWQRKRKRRAMLLRKRKRGNRKRRVSRWTLQTLLQMLKTTVSTRTVSSNTKSK